MEEIDFWPYRDFDEDINMNNITNIIFAEHSEPVPTGAEQHSSLAEKQRSKSSVSLRCCFSLFDEWSTGLCLFFFRGMSQVTS